MTTADYLTVTYLLFFRLLRMFGVLDSVQPISRMFPVVQKSIFKQKLPFDTELVALVATMQKNKAKVYIFLDH